MLRIEHPYNCPSRIHEGIIDETRGRSPRDHLLFLSVSLRWTAIGVFYATCILAIHSLSERTSSGASRAETVEPNSDDASWHGHEKKMGRSDLRSLASRATAIQQSLYLGNPLTQRKDK